MNSIFTRRSIRKYQERPVEEEKIRLLLGAAMAAPTAVNQREWEFVVVTDKAILGRLSEASPYTKPAGRAPLAIVPVGDSHRLKSPGYFQQDLAAATENIRLEAEELGLGAVWMGIAPVEERMDTVSGILELPEHIQPFSIIAIGYPDETRPEEDRYEEDRVHYNKY